MHERPTMTHPGDRRPAHRAGLLAVALAAALLASCVQVQPHRSTQPPRHPSPKVLLMPPDVLVLEIGAAGLPLPQPHWTRAAERDLSATAESVLTEHEGEMMSYRVADGVVPYAPDHRPALELHRTVLNTILSYRYGAAGPNGGERRLVTKSEGLAWTLGDTVRPLRRDYEADYALFLVYRQATSSSGRALLAAAGFVLFGAIGPTSQSIGLASLVDLHSGDIVWTNVLSGQGMDVRRPDGLKDKARQLLSEMPL